MKLITEGNAMISKRRVKIGVEELRGKKLIVSYSTFDSRSRGFILSADPIPKQGDPNCMYSTYQTCYQLMTHTPWNTVQVYETP